MALPYEYFVTALHGIPNTNLQAVEAGTVWTSDSFGDPTCSIDYIPLPEVNTWNQIVNHDAAGWPSDQWNAFSYEVIFCRPQKIVDDVAYLKFRKSSGTDYAYIDFCSEDNAILDSIGLLSNFNCSRVYNESPPPLYGQVSQVKFQLAAWNNPALGLQVGFAMCNEITSLAREQQPLFNPYYLQNSVVTDGFMEQWLLDIIGEDIWEAESGGEGGESGAEGDPAGGDGEFFRNDVDIPFSEIPTISASASGFVGLYKMDATQLQNLAADLWSDNFFQSLVKNFSNPFDNIISLGMIPYGGIYGTLTNVKIGNYTCPVAAGDKLASNYYTLNCGTISVKEYYRHFADYDTKIQLYLPYCGTIEIEPAEVMTGSIEVQYIFDIFTGSCMAEVMCYTGGAHHVLYNKEGNIRAEIPYCGRDFAEYYKGMISSITSMAVGAATIAASGGLAAVPALGAAGSAMAGASMGMAGASNLMWNKPSVMRSGNASGTAGLLGIQYPYLIFTTPNYFGGKSFGEKCGYISNLPCKIGEQRGFLQSEVDFEKLSGIAAPIEVLQKVKSALAEGIYIEDVN